MKRRRNGKRLMGLKLDLKKAYDMVRWDFFQDTFVQIGFRLTGFILL